MKKIILCGFIFCINFNANTAENISQNNNFRDQKIGQLEERFIAKKTHSNQDEAAKFETSSGLNETPPINHFEGWGKLSDQEKFAVKKHHEELRSKAKTPIFEQKAQ